MQTFKEISYQNYINLNETQHNEALLQYKRNAQLLAQIFSFQSKEQTVFKAKPIVTEEQIRDMEKQVENQKLQGLKKCEEIEQKTKEYARLLKKIKSIKNETERAEVIEEIKQADLYDECHPFFVDGSPFFMNSTDQDVLEVTQAVQIPDINQLSLFKIR